MFPCELIVGTNAHSAPGFPEYLVDHEPEAAGEEVIPKHRQ